jgi:hypothetical protein
MRSQLGAVVLVLGLGAAPATAADGHAIRSPDGAAACSVASTKLTCSNRDLQRRQPPVSLSLGLRGDPVVVRSRLSWSDRTPVARPGPPQTVGRFSCRLVAGGLLCVNSSGAAVAVAADRVSVLPAPAVKG